MIVKLAVAWSLMAVCVVIHAAGVSAALRWCARQSSAGTGRATWLLVRVAGWMILLHLIEIMAWATVYAGAGAIPGFTSAAYFSAVTYTTTGYGDLTLPESWRLVGGVEALTGILMCGLSTGFFVAIVTRILHRERHGSEEPLL